MKNKKGEQAIEFLMTYSWAILCAIIVIGILGYYYFSSDISTPNQDVYNLECLGMKFCEEIGLEFNRVIIYNDEIVCTNNIKNLTEIDYTFGVTYRKNLMEKYPECSEED